MARASITASGSSDTGAPSFAPVSTSVKTNIRKLNSRFDGMSRSSIQNQ